MVDLRRTKLCLHFKKGDKMAFLTLQDLSGSCEVVVFPSVYKETQSFVQKDQLIYVRGKVDARDDSPKILADEIVPLADGDQFSLVAEYTLEAKGAHIGKFGCFYDLA